MNSIKIIKKDGTLETFDASKIAKAVSKSADRVNVTLSEENLSRIVGIVEKGITDDFGYGAVNVPIAKIHTYVELALDEVNPNVARSYRDYRNYKQDFVHIMDEVFKMNQNIMYLADKSNANTESALSSTKRVLLYRKLSRELYQKTFLKPNEVQAIKEGYFYIHDLGDRLHCTHNCTVVDFSGILSKGFEMSNVFYKPPKRFASALGVVQDTILNVSAQQYRWFYSC